MPGGTHSLKYMVSFRPEKGDDSNVEYFSKNDTTRVFYRKECPPAS